MVDTRFGTFDELMEQAERYVLPHTSWVNLGFFKGAELTDPAGLLEGTGAQLRHVKVRTLDAAEDQAPGDLIEAALSERRTALGR
jgi:hypothetical protein